MCEAYLYEKCARKMLMKITTGVIFMQHFTCTFFVQKILHSFSLLKVWLCNFFGRIILAQKLLLKLLEKLTIAPPPTPEFEPSASSESLLQVFICSGNNWFAVSKS